MDSSSASGSSSSRFCKSNQPDEKAELKKMHKLNLHKNPFELLHMEGQIHMQHPFSTDSSST
jgi:hypothetical protein